MIYNRHGFYGPRTVQCLLLFFGLAVSGLSIGAQSSIEAGFVQNGVTAHRGYSGHYVENTLEAFTEAIALGVDWIECDIFITADSQIVVTHDASTLRVSGVDALISESTYSSLAALDVAVGFRKSNGLSIEDMPPKTMPLLSELLSLVMGQSRTRLSIQPKDGSTAAAIDIIREMDAESWVGFNDGSLEKMSLVKQLAPEIPVFWDRFRIEEVEQDIEIATARGFESLIYNRRLITNEAIQQVHSAELEFGVWTVNDEIEMQAFIEQGVDRLYTDFPAIALDLFDNIKR